MKKPFALHNLVWWTAFAVATFALSRVFQASRLLTSHAADASVFNLLLWLGVLAISFLVIGYDGYIQARAQGKVVHTLWFYEKLYAIFNQKKEQTPSCH